MSSRGGAVATFLIAGVAAFMTALDNLVVTTALPTIQRQFRASLEGLEWTVNSYTLTYAVCLLTAAVLGDRFGRRRVFVTGLLVFALASAVAASAGSVGVLIAARAVQGIGAALIFPLALTLVVMAVSPGRRGLAMAGFGGMSGLGIALGPWIGGLVVEYGDWHWVFWINVPIGLVLAPLAVRLLSRSRGAHDRLDVRGTLLVTAGLFGVVYGLIRSVQLGWLHAQVVLPILAGLAVLGTFVWWEQRAVFPIIPPRLFRSRGFTLSNAVALLVQGGMFGAVFLLTQFLQNALGHSPLRAGAMTLPWTMMPLLVAPLAGMFGDRIGPRRLLTAGALLQAAALAWFAVVSTREVPYGMLLPGMVVAGVGMGLFFALAARVTMDFVSKDEEGLASGVNNAMRQFGVVLGVAVLSAVFAATGSYSSPEPFVAGLRPALWAGTAIVLLGAIAAILVPRPLPAVAESSMEAPLSPTVSG
ncbi:MFS transporter [Nonomuraea jabiensis]|uniref:EmrB/QacA subfamily drug resistance transporter n=1 Tax=Nonomuraea jabiensis TaxID=882448 RepID=A0A7W9GDA5_9ACTN|nr:MFS transporter [Nonomuraea jabiensis]MBB5781685.1 EmrB/QacA subfamily drug resistance transporter [Nonomuraea jabiensis]